MISECHDCGAVLDDITDLEPCERCCEHTCVKCRREVDNEILCHACRNPPPLRKFLVNGRLTTENPHSTPEKKEAYKQMLQGLSEEDLYAKAKEMIWFSAYANNNPQSAYHWQCDYCYDEAQRREKPEIYNRAHAANMRECR